MHDGAVEIDGSGGDKPGEAPSEDSFAVLDVYDTRPCLRGLSKEDLRSTRLTWLVASQPCFGVEVASAGMSGAQNSECRTAVRMRSLTESDPISLEPRFPPFDLGTDESHATYFDGRVLANYLVSTGSFIHPISRRELTRDECKRLDAYLREHRLGNAGVLYAFDHQEEYKKDRSPTLGQALRHSIASWRRLPPLSGGGCHPAHKGLLNNLYQSEDESDGVEDDEYDEL
jgi:hypothetical protein